MGVSQIQRPLFYLSSGDCCPYIAIHKTDTLFCWYQFQLRGLSVSRSLGDNFLKREIPGLTCVPLVSQPVRIKDDGRDVAVCATRGLWRSLEVGEVISCATASVFEKSSSNSSASQLAPSPRWTPSAGAARLVDLVRRRRGKEDVTVVVVRLEDTCGPGG